MKPAICSICGKSASEEESGKKGDWVEFADYDAAEANSLSHPMGLEYICIQHLTAASRLRHKMSCDALEELKNMFPTEQRDTSNNHKHPWWRRWLS